MKPLNERPTPMTDELELKLARLGAKELSFWTEYARELERKLVACREALNELFTAHSKALETLEQTK